MTELETLIEADAQSDARLIEASERLKRADARVRQIEAQKPRQQTQMELIKEAIATHRHEKYGVPLSEGDAGR